MESTVKPALDQFREEWLEELGKADSEQSKSSTATYERPSTATDPSIDSQHETTQTTASTEETTGIELAASIVATSDSPEWLKEAQIVHDLSQDLAAGSITIRPATIHDLVRKHDLPPRRVRMGWKKSKSANVYSRQPGKPDRFLNTLPIDAARAFSCVLDDAVSQSGLPSNKINKFIFPVVSDDQSDALATVLAWQRQIFDSETCHIIPFKRINKLPVYRYYRMAQTFRATGDDHMRQEMLQRIENMKYSGGWYKPAIDDVKTIMQFIPPEHNIRRGVIESIAKAWVDRRLGGRDQIDKLWNENDEFRREVDAAVERTLEERANRQQNAA